MRRTDNNSNGFGGDHNRTSHNDNAHPLLLLDSLFKSLYEEEDTRTKEAAVVESAASSEDNRRRTGPLFRLRKQREDRLKKYSKKGPSHIIQDHDEWSHESSMSSADLTSPTTNCARNKRGGRQEDYFNAHTSLRPRESSKKFDRLIPTSDFSSTQSESIFSPLEIFGSWFAVSRDAEDEVINDKTRLLHRDAHDGAGGHIDHNKLADMEQFERKLRDLENEESHSEDDEEETIDSGGSITIFESIFGGTVYADERNHWGRKSTDHNRNRKASFIISSRSYDMNSPSTNDVELGSPRGLKFSVDEPIAKPRFPLPNNADNIRDDGERKPKSSQYQRIVKSPSTRFTRMGAENRATLNRTAHKVGTERAINVSQQHLAQNTKEQEMNDLDALLSDYAHQYGVDSSRQPPIIPRLRSRRKSSGLVSTPKTRNITTNSLQPNEDAIDGFRAENQALDARDDSPSRQRKSLLVANRESRQEEVDYGTQSETPAPERRSCMRFRSESSSAGKVNKKEDDFGTSLLVRQRELQSDYVDASQPNESLYVDETSSARRTHIPFQDEGERVASQRRSCLILPGEIRLLQRRRESELAGNKNKAEESMHYKALDGDSVVEESKCSIPSKRELTMFKRTRPRADSDPHEEWSVDAESRDTPNMGKRSLRQVFGRIRGQRKHSVPVKDAVISDDEDVDDWSSVSDSTGTDSPSDESSESDSESDSDDSSFYHRPELDGFRPQFDVFSVSYSDDGASLEDLSLDAIAD